jgi:hypothetical protein
MDTPALGFDDPKTQGILALAAGLLQAGGPSRYPVPFGAALGSAMSNASKQQQQQTLINLEQQKSALAQAQVLHAIHGMNMQSWALAGGQGQPPAPPAIPPAMLQAMGMPAGALSQTAQSQQQPQQLGQQPDPQAQPVSLQQSQEQSPAPQPGGIFSGLPPEAQQAIKMNIALPGSGNIAWQASQPIIGREGGIYRRTPGGGMEINPAWLSGERQRMELQKGIEDQHTIVDVPMADGKVQKMTKAQALNLTQATNEITNAIPGLNAEAVSSIQRQLAAEPDKPIDVDITLGGRRAKLTLQPLGGRGFTTGQSTEARAAQESSGKQAGSVQSQIDEEANGALQSRRILGEMRGLAEDFTPSKVAPFKRAMGEWAQALKLPGNWAEEIKAAESQQALQKLTAQMATAAMKQFTNRGTQMEFKTFLANNPNAELTPGGFRKVLEFMDASADASLKKQQAYIDWRKMNPVERSQDFLAEWNKKQTAELAQPAAPTAPANQPNTFDQLPPANQFRGRVIRDTTSGKMMKSDGMSWKPL